MMKLLRSTLRTNVDLRFKAHGLILCVYIYICIYVCTVVSMYLCINVNVSTDLMYISVHIYVGNVGF